MIPIADEIPARDEMLDLYGSVGWTVYARDPERLERALAGSDLVATVGDGATICYVQDLLVRPDRQRGGAGEVEAGREPRDDEEDERPGGGGAEHHGGRDRDPAPADGILDVPAEGADGVHAQPGDEDEPQPPNSSRCRKLGGGIRTHAPLAMS